MAKNIFLFWALSVFVLGTVSAFSMDIPAADTKTKHTARYLIFGVKMGIRIDFGKSGGVAFESIETKPKAVIPADTSVSNNSVLMTLFPEGFVNDFLARSPFAKDSRIVLSFGCRF